MRKSHKTKKVEEEEDETEDSGNETLSESTVVIATGSYRRLVKNKTSELGTRQHCRNIVIMFSGHKIVVYCICS